MSRRPRPRPPAAFTIMEIVILVIIVAALIGLLLPALGVARRTANSEKKSSQLRVIHQSMVIYASSNGTYLPGLDQSGEFLPDSNATGHSGGGATPGARLWILLNGQYMPGDILINPMDTRTKWTTGAVTTANFSYAFLQIGDKRNDAGRLAEWRDQANAQAAMVSDRNNGAGAADNQVQSLWTKAPGEWKGNLVWGDGSTEFIKSQHGLVTRYNGVSSKNDNLFLDGPTAPGSPATERGTTPGSNAMMVWY